MGTKNFISLFYKTAAVVVILVILAIAILGKIDTIYNITAHTEVVTIHITQKPISRINIYNASIYNLEPEAILKDFSGTLEINRDVNFIIERVSQGNVILELDCESCDYVAKLYNHIDGSLIHTAGDYLYIEIKNIVNTINKGETLVIPFTGTVKIGKSIDVEEANVSSPVLRSGTITMTGVSNMGSKNFLAGTSELYLGDELILEDSESFGFVSINENPALQLACRTQAKNAIIIKPGPKDNESGLRVSATFFDRFKSDQLFQAFSFIMGILLVLVSIMDFSINLKSYKSQNQNRNEN